MLRLTWLVWLFALRLLAPYAARVSAGDAAPPATQAHFALADDDADASADDPTDLDDGDDDAGDAALPAGIAAGVPHPATVTASWALITLTDKDHRDPLFRPPRAA